MLVECSGAFLELCSEGKDGFFVRVVTGDETSDRHYKPESQQHLVAVI